jgi:ubiquinone/menaquinone biosynthesis C-methylase UbiE
VKRGYQLNYSDINVEMLDYEGRMKKAKKIISVLTKECGTLEEKKCLDIGCSGGIITHHLSSFFHHVTGVDIDEKAINKANKQFKSAKCEYKLADSMNLPFQDNQFDIVICNHIYEHVPDSQKLMNEIYRVLKNDGVCYFGAGNKYMIKENHYKLYFLSWLPQKLADSYIKTLRNIDNYYEKHLSYYGLKRLVSNYEISDYTEQIIITPQAFFEDDRKLFKILRLLPHSIRRLLIRWLTQTFIWVIKK